MFARMVSLQLKPNSIAAFTETIEKKVIPLMRQQQGFQDEIAFVVPGSTDAVSVSVWNRKEHAEAYHRATYPAVLSALMNVIEGTPQVHLYEVSNSTFHTLLARVAV